MNKPIQKRILKLALVLVTFWLLFIYTSVNRAEAARTDSKWQEKFGTYIQTSWPEGRNILINGVNKYLNFNAISGSTGYGFRDNAGTMEAKNNGGSWSAIASLGALADYLKLDQTTPQTTTGEFVFQKLGVGGATHPLRGRLDILGETVTIDDVTTSNTTTLGFSYGPYINYYANGDTYTYSVYAYKDVAGTTIYSQNPLIFSGTDDGSTNGMYFTSADWDVVPDALGYRVIVTDPTAGAYDNYYFDTPYTHLGFGLNNVGYDDISGQYISLGNDIVTKSANSGEDYYTDSNGHLVSTNNATFNRLFSSDGTTATPAFSFTSYPDMGMYGKSISSLAFAWGGYDRLILDNTSLSLNNSLIFRSSGVGTALLPSYSWVTDPNTGPWNAGADTYAISTGGTEAIRINSTQYFGIGGTPTTKFELIGGQATFRTTVGASADTTANLQLYDTTSSAINVGGGMSFYGNYTGSSPTIGGTIKLYKNNATAGNWGFDMGIATRAHGGSNVAEVMRLLGSGEVGIGITAPTTKLSVNGKVSADKGTALLPTYTFVGNLNTGMWSSGSNLIDFALAGTNVFEMTTAFSEPVLASKLSTAINLQANAGQNVFRGIDGWTATWADSVVTSYFQVGRANGNTMFSAYTGTPYNRLSYTVSTGAGKGIVYDTLTSALAVPTAYFDIRLGGNSKFAIDYTTGNTVMRAITNWVGANTGLPEADLGVEDNATSTNIVTQNVWVQVTDFNNVYSENDANASTSTDDITIGKAGKYKIIFTADLHDGTVNQRYEVAVFKNNGATQLGGLRTHVFFDFATSEPQLMLAGNVPSLANGDTIEVWVRNLTGTGDITFDFANLSIVHIGG